MAPGTPVLKIISIGLSFSFILALASVVVAPYDLGKTPYGILTALALVIVATSIIQVRRGWKNADIMAGIWGIVTACMLSIATGLMPPL